MRLLLLLSLISFGAIAATHPDDGLYRCVQGNNESICDQEVKVIFVRGKLDSIRVMYEGYCNGQGPYTYECDRNICTDGAIQITFEEANRYSWENLSYGFQCRMEKIF